ncbi:hypothetical protein KIPB_016518, partial [Kipferlia bialata]
LETLLSMHPISSWHDQTPDITHLSYGAKLALLQTMLILHSKNAHVPYHMCSYLASLTEPQVSEGEMVVCLQTTSKGFYVSSDSGDVVAHSYRVPTGLVTVYLRVVNNQGEATCKCVDADGGVRLRQDSALTCARLENPTSGMDMVTMYMPVMLDRIRW